MTWPENMYAGQLIAQLQATDADSENSGLLRYSLSRRNKEIARQLLHVDPVTGDVTLKDTLDREQHDKLVFLVLSIFQCLYEKFIFLQKNLLEHDAYFVQNSRKAMPILA